MGVDAGVGVGVEVWVGVGAGAGAGVGVGVGLCVLGRDGGLRVAGGGESIYVGGMAGSDLQSRAS